MGLGKIVLIGLLLGNAIGALFRPWLGVVLAYIFAIFGPQFIWYWSFEGIRPFYFAALPTFAGFALAIGSGRVSFKPLWENRGLWMLIYWMAIIFSYQLGPYVEVVGKYRWYEAKNIFIQFNQILLFYFIATLLIDNKPKILALALVLTGATVYLTYWANLNYLTGNYAYRMPGPIDGYGNSLYFDENSFAMLFVCGLPFLFYLGWYFKNPILRYGIWLIVPLGWHAVFLTGSRGGLVGLGVTVLVTAYRFPHRIIGVLVVPALIVAFVWQGGSVMKDRAATIDDYRTEDSARTRLEAWEAGLKMAIAHPLTGVGVASFGVAFSDFSDKVPRQAHNTFVQITAEMGVLAGLAYSIVLTLTLMGLWDSGRRTVLQKAHQTAEAALLYCLNEATLVAIIGVTVCSLFLSLESYEVIYYLLILGGAVSSGLSNALDEMSATKTVTSAKAQALADEND